MNRIASLMVCVTAIAVAGSAGAADIDWTKADQAIGKKGADQAGGVRKFSFPRSDLKVTGAHAPAQGLAARSAREPARVVFVCEHGSVKSLIATVYFNRSAQERGLLYRAVARGTAPKPVVPGPVQEGLRADGFDVSKFEPQLFKASDVDEASLVVSFDQDIGKVVGGRARHLRWDNLPGADYARVRDAIVRHVDALVDELARSASP
jgi:arsenate reductase (thioredoxin)